MLGWSINLFRVFGIQLALHASFPFLLLYYALDGWQTDGWPGMAWRVLVVLGFFTCVVLHELGHSLTARRYGIQVPRILLTPLGGIAEFAEFPRKPSAELLITGAGPAVNFVIVLVLLPVLLALSDSPVPWTWSGFAVEMFWGNLVMGVFNLLPVFPMDGGRLLRALLALRLGYLRATRVAALIAKCVCPILAGVAVFWLHAYLLGFLFIFVMFIGDAEYQAVLRREREAAYWAEMARRVREMPPPGARHEPPLLSSGPN